MDNPFVTELYSELSTHLSEKLMIVSEQLMSANLGKDLTEEKAKQEVLNDSDTNIDLFEEFSFIYVL